MPKKLYKGYLAGATEPCSLSIMPRKYYSSIIRLDREEKSFGHDRPLFECHAATPQSKLPICTGPLRWGRFCIVRSFFPLPSRSGKVVDRAAGKEHRTAHVRQLVEHLSAIVPLRTPSPATVL